jgi:hypothetical protein
MPNPPPKGNIYSSQIHQFFNEGGRKRQKNHGNIPISENIAGGFGRMNNPKSVVGNENQAQKRERLGAAA